MTDDSGSYETTARERFDRIEARLDQIERRLEQLETRLRRLAAEFGGPSGRADADQ